MSFLFLTLIPFAVVIESLPYNSFERKILLIDVLKSLINTKVCLTGLSCLKTIMLLPLPVHKTGLNITGRTLEEMWVVFIRKVFLRFSNNKEWFTQENVGSFIKFLVYKTICLWERTLTTLTENYFWLRGTSHRDTITINQEQGQVRCQSTKSSIESPLTLMWTHKNNV